MNSKQTDGHFTSCNFIPIWVKFYTFDVQNEGEVIYMRFRNLKIGNFPETMEDDFSINTMIYL